MKKVVFKIWKFPVLSETFIVNQAVIAIKLGYDVIILAEEVLDIKENGNLRLFEKYDLKKKIVLLDYKVPNHKITRYLKAFLLILYNIKYLSYLLEFCRGNRDKGLTPIYQFTFFNKFKDCEIFHIQFGTNKHPVDELKKVGFLKSSIITSFHGHDLNFPINNRIRNDGYYNTLFDTADFLVCNTPYLKEKLLELGAPVEKIKTIPVAVDTSFFKPNKERNDKNEIIKLVTVGRLEDLKGQKWGLLAVDILRKKNIKLEYVIVGTGSRYLQLKDRVEKLGLNETVKFMGSLSQIEVRNTLQTSDIFLMTSITDPDYGAESQGLVIAEAQACGLPIVAFNSGGIKHTLIDEVSGFLCKEKDIECSSQKLQLLIEDQELRHSMGKKAREFIEDEFSEDSVLKKWTEIYGQC